MRETRIGIIGLGYVGLPLAVACSKVYKTIGFDINSSRISDLNRGNDITQEINKVELDEAFEKGLQLTSNLNDIKSCNFYIVTVPTPVDKNNNPNFNPLKSASKSVGSVIEKEDVVVYESTVYPGATEEICIPLLKPMDHRHLPQFGKI